MVLIFDATSAAPLLGPLLWPAFFFLFLRALMSKAARESRGSKGQGSGSGGAVPAPVAGSNRVETGNIFCSTYQSLSGLEMTLVTMSSSKTETTTLGRTAATISSSSSRVVNRWWYPVVETYLATVNSYTTPDIMVQDNGHMRTGRMVDRGQDPTSQSDCNHPWISWTRPPDPTSQS